MGPAPTVGGYSVVRRLKKYEASGAATAKMAIDHKSAASTGCCMGQAGIEADGIGVPEQVAGAGGHGAHRVPIGDGLQPVRACRVVGTSALEMKASGNRTMKPDRLRPTPGPCCSGRRRPQPTTASS